MIEFEDEPQPTVTIIEGDCLAYLRSMRERGEQIQMCVTSPPYFGLRDYGMVGQIGLESNPQEYVDRMVEIFSAVREVLKDDGTLWLNLGDSYANDNKWGGSSGGKHVTELHGNTGIGRGKKTTGLKAKNLIGIPWRVAFALQSDGWYLRSDIIWHKPNPMPESVTDRPTRSHEYIFLFSKLPQYFYDHEAIKEDAVNSRPRSTPDANGSTVTGTPNGRHTLGDAIPESERRVDKQRGHSRRHDGFNDRWDAMPKTEQCAGKRNKRDVWTVAPANYKDAHFATFPPKLIEPCILAGCPAGGMVLDPFAGSGTTGEVALKNGRSAVLLELNPAYAALARIRCGLAPLEVAGQSKKDLREAGE